MLGGSRLQRLRPGWVGSGSALAARAEAAARFRETTAAGVNWPFGVEHTRHRVAVPRFCSVHAAQLHGRLRVGTRRPLPLHAPARAAPGSAAGATSLASSNCPAAAAAGSGDVAGLPPSARRLGAFARLGLPAPAAAKGAICAGSGWPAAAAAGSSLECACACRPLVGCLVLAILGSWTASGLAGVASTGEAAGLLLSAAEHAALTGCVPSAAGASVPAPLTSGTDTAPRANAAGASLALAAAGARPDSTCLRGAASGRSSDVCGVAPAAGTDAPVRCRAALCCASAGAVPAPAPAAGVAPAQPADSCCATACLRPLCPAAAPALALDPLPAEIPLDGPLSGTTGPACCRLSAAASTFCTPGTDGSKGTGPSDV